MAVAGLLLGALVFTLTFAAISIACDYRYLILLDLAAMTARAALDREESLTHFLIRGSVFRIALFLPQEGKQCAPASGTEYLCFGLWGRDPASPPCHGQDRRPGLTNLSPRRRPVCSKSATA